MSNKGFYTGRLAKAVELTRHAGDVVVAKFTLMRNENMGKDEQGNARDERVVALQFTAFGGRAEAISNHVMVGDALQVEYRIENNNYKKDGVDQFGHNFVIEEFEFGAPGEAKRAQLDAKKNKG